MDNFATCECQHCGGRIKFDADDFQQREEVVVDCPHCQQQTRIFAPKATEVPRPPVLSNQILATIGDIAITEDSVITPNGNGRLSDAQWIFTDLSRTETKIPTVAIVLAIIFAIACLFGLLFLLMKEKVTSGYVEVSVKVGDVFHKTQIPIESQSQIDKLRGTFNTVQSMSTNARFISQARRQNI